MFESITKYSSLYLLTYKLHKEGGGGVGEVWRHHIRELIII